MNDAEKKEIRAYIDSVIQSKGDDWVIAAIVDGSIGYYTPLSAKYLLDHYKNGHDTDYSERGLACFQGNLLDELIFDVRNFEIVEEFNPEKVKTLIQIVQKTKDIRDFDFNSSFSILYPTLV